MLVRLVAKFFLSDNVSEWGGNGEEVSSGSYLLPTVSVPFLVAHIPYSQSTRLTPFYLVFLKAVLKKVVTISAPKIRPQK